MRMWQPALLELDRPTMRHDHAEHAIFYEVFEQGFQLQSKDASDQLWPIDGMFSFMCLFMETFVVMEGGIVIYILTSFCVATESIAIASFVNYFDLRYYVHVRPLKSFCSHLC